MVKDAFQELAFDLPEVEHVHFDDRDEVLALDVDQKPHEVEEGW